LPPQLCYPDCDLPSNQKTACFQRFAWVLADPLLTLLLTK
jgi:hypothetical protein